uniref:Transposase n=1 Tax=Ignavibacterium album TaxID=591197 RepID=A0A832G841_9BACT
MGRRGRFNLTDESIFFVTTTVVGFARVFTKDTYCDLLIRNILHYQNKYHFTILAYVIMPSHFHWIIIVNRQYGTISDIMRDIKKYSAWDIMEEIEKNDENLMDIFKSASKGFQNQKRKFWMQRFDDEVIRNEKMFWTKLHYIHNNPVEAGLVIRPEDYKYSSARNYVRGDHSVMFVDTEYAGVEIK